MSRSHECERCREGPEGTPCATHFALIDYPDVVIRPLACVVLAALPLLAQKAAPFEVEEATISQVHDAMKAGRLTCRALVGMYLKRIEAYDKNGPAINSIVTLNPE